MVPTARGLETHHPHRQVTAIDGEDRLRVRRVDHTDEVAIMPFDLIISETLKGKTVVEGETQDAEAEGRRPVALSALLRHQAGRTL